MADITLERYEVKQRLKQALVKVVQEEPQIFGELLDRAISQMAIAKALEKEKDISGLNTEAIFPVLEL
ncbi:MAG: hypothetical protein F6J93_15105 [Oscillatoria sp. SIO1A7]|nr:hypothetical protein [Oscillatoria sp. SIO1A7]